jgi:hypothetical protein
MGSHLTILELTPSYPSLADIPPSQIDSSKDYPCASN